MSTFISTEVYDSRCRLFPEINSGNTVIAVDDIVQHRNHQYRYSLDFVICRVDAIFRDNYQNTFLVLHR